ncbi:SdrD B-like protein [Lentzea atacamensis]|uniref:SdrD B-like protein n=2 Tax=Lentzea atacamensis TaxID=531938 RepID=A0A316HAJ3_9PSEU|nr:SdrD B-like domain-containing protein [Lentzea atacamensis]PWK77486.1 SdrD B-like protein [Lentzea atacamensis]
MKRPLAAALAALLAASFAVVIPTAHAGPGDGTLSVQVIRDVNGNGNYDAAVEVGVQGAAVLVTDPAGNIATGTTDVNGSVTVGLGPVSGGKYRVQVNPPAGSVLQPAPAGGTLESNTMFVDVSGGKNVTVTTGLWNPADYCQSSPTLATACQRATRDRDGNSMVNGSARSLVTMPFDARGTNSAPAQVANQGATGTVFGLAYRKQDKRLFSAAFAKRLTNYGPGGAGAIYVTPAAGGATTLFTTVPNAGGATHNHQTNFDGAFYAVPGTQSLGDIDMSEDGSELYVVNMADKKLYVYDATQPTAAAAKASYVIPSACPTASDWRPGALGVRDGVVYVGGVCSGASTKKIADVKAVVMTFSGGSFSPPVLTKVLDFQRGRAFNNRPASNVWYPWTDNWNDTAANDLRHNSYPMPLLIDIGVENNGDLALGFRDRFGDMGGFWIPAPDGSGGEWETVSGGDLNRACKTPTGYTWEGTGGCKNNHVHPNGGNEQAADVVEYYPGEYFAFSDTNYAPHLETAQGAVALVPGELRMPAIVMDPTGVRTGGVGWFDRGNGSMANTSYSNAYKIVDEFTEGWGKANGLADLEALCDLAPVQLGNRVWFDTDADGVQDGDEPAVAGVKVTATPCAGGAALPVKTTNAKGEYYFGAADGLKPETCYNLTFDYSGVNTAALPGAPPVESLQWTVKEAGPDRVVDSNVDAAGSTQVTTGKSGTADHTIDAGINAKVTNSLGDLVWVDTNRNGLQDAGEPGVQGVTVVLKKGDGTQVGTSKQTDAQGKYLFDQLEDGTYMVCFDLSTLPAQYAGYVFTGKDAGDDTKDSDADAADGCTATTTLGAAKRQDLTLDAGLVPPNNRLGDLVWVDTNRNGLQDGDEPGVPGVTVTLKDGSGATVGTSKQTDAQGKYLFDQLPNGTYQVCFDLSTAPAEYAGYLLTRLNAGDDALDSDADPATKCTHTTTLGPDKREDLTLDAGIRPPNKLGDYVWIDTNKNGQQDDGEPPVPGVTVKVGDLTTTTNEQGEYVFDKLPDGEYTVCFDKTTLPAQYADYVPTTPNAGTDDAKDSDAAVDTWCAPPTKLDVDRPEDLTLDLGLIPPVNRLGDYVWIDVNKDGLQDATDIPVEGVTVKLNTGATTTTDAQGKYLFSDLPDGTYTVCFDLANLPAAVKDYLVTSKDVGSDDAKDSDADPATGCVPAVTLGVSQRENLTLDMGLVSPPNKLGDYVWVDANRNGVQDAGEAPVPGMTVKVLDGQGNQVGEPVVTDAQGKYLFDNLPDGTFTVCFDIANMPAAYAGYLPTRPDAGGDDAKDSDADATGCTPLTSLGSAKREDLTLDLGIRPPNTLGDLVWTDTNKNGVQDPGEPGVPGVTVMLQTADGTPVGTPVTTDDQGRYEFPNLPDGTYKVCFDIANLPDAVKDNVPTTPNAGGDDAKDSDADVATGCTPTTTLNVDRPEDLTLDLGLIPPVNRLGDYVWIDVNKDGLQDATDIPVEGVTVKLNTGATTTTDAQGKYLFSDLPDGTYTVCFDLANLPAAVKDYLVTSKDVGSDDAKDSDADPATGCVPAVTLGVSQRENLTLDMGLVSPPNKLGDYVWVDANRNGVQDAGEAPVPGMPVKLIDQDGKEITTTTGADGKYLFGDLPDGTYKVCFGPMPAGMSDFQFTKPNAGDDAADSDADPATGCTSEVTLGLGKREDLTLDAGIHAPVNRIGDFVWVDANNNGLQDDGEKPVEGVTVELNTGATTKTDAQGKYLFSDLPDGTYTVCFDIANLPAAVADYTLTKVNAGDDAKDSDADPATGCTLPVTLGVGQRENLTLDAGLVAPPNSIGDLVWYDTNRNGVQDPGEPGVPGVTVTLVDEQGNPVGVPVKTGPDGKYEFPNIPDGTYKVCFEMGALPGQYAGYVATTPNVGDDAKDSDVDPASGCTPPVTVGVGQREQKPALGLVPPTNRVGDLVWYDNNSNGVQDAGEPGVPNLPVFLQDGSGKPVAQTTTDKDGKYLFTDLPDGEYKVCFNADPRTGLVAGRQLTKPHVGDDGKDSDANPATGCTHVVKLGKDKRVDLTLDAGLLPKPPLASTGAAVWALLGSGLALLLAGAFMTLVARRRRS